MNLTVDNYFGKESAWAYMSCSQWKAFEECQASALANIGKSEEKLQFLQGHFFEACIVPEDKQTFIEEHPEMMKKRGGGMYAEFEQVEKSADYFLRQEKFRSIIDTCDKQVIVTGTIGGVPFKGCVDFYDPHTGDCYDSKLMRSFDTQWSDKHACRVPWWMVFGYHYQAAIYQSLVYQSFGIKGHQHLIAATKENVPDVQFVKFDNDFLSQSLEYIKHTAPLHQRVKMGQANPMACGHCDYCKDNRIIDKPEVARWTLK